MSILPWLLLAGPLVGSLLLFLTPRTLRTSSVPAFGTAVAGAALVLALCLVATFDYSDPGQMQFVSDLPWIPAIGVGLRLGLDGLSLAMVVLTTLLVFCCLAYTTRVRPEGGRIHALVGLVLVLELGMLGTFLALDLVVFFLFFEVVLVPMWFVIALWGDPHDQAGRRRAATTFLLYTVLGSAVMLVGFMLVFAGAGTFDLIALADAHGRGIPAGLQLAAAITIGLGLAVKAPMWPLHSWLPDAHSKAPTIGSVLLAGVLLKMGTYGFFRVWLPVVPDGARAVAPYLAGFAAVGIVYGALACLAQTDLKRLIAYSSVGHMGFVLLGIATLSTAGVNGGIFAGIAHGLITGMLFFLVGAIKDRRGTSDLAELSRHGLYGSAPRLGALLTFGAVASLGLPGLAGFWGEMLALLGAFAPGDGLNRTTYLVFMAIGGLGAILTAWYFLVLVRRVCQGSGDTVGSTGAAPLSSASTSSESSDLIPDVRRVELWSWGPLVVATLALGLLPMPLLGLTQPVVAVLLGGGGL